MAAWQQLLGGYRRAFPELAAELEAGAAASLFRFGASRAYDEIVQLRLQTIGERKIEGFPTWASFLARRMAPAMSPSHAPRISATSA